MNQLEVGNSLIHFRLPDIHEQIVDTQAYQGKKLMISFYRYAECMFCNLRIHDFLKRYPRYQEAGLHKIAFFQSPKEDILQYAGKDNPPFPIIPDSNRDIYKQYKVVIASAMGFVKGGLRVDRFIRAMANGYFMKMGKGSKTLIPADFLIDETGTIVNAYYGSDISDHIPFAEIEAFLEL